MTYDDDRGRERDGRGEREEAKEGCKLYIGNLTDTLRKEAVEEE